MIIEMEITAETLLQNFKERYPLRYQELIDSAKHVIQEQEATRTSSEENGIHKFSLKYNPRDTTLEEQTEIVRDYMPVMDFEWNDELETMIKNMVFDLIFNMTYNSMREDVFKFIPRTRPALTDESNVANSN